MPQDVAAQAAASLKNVQAVLEAAGSSMGKVLKTTVYLTDINDFAAINEVYATFFKPPFPARSCFAVKSLPLNAKIEIEAVARPITVFSPVVMPGGDVTVPSRAIFHAPFAVCGKGGISFGGWQQP